tara:strand:+ start:5635 stop:6594 length:960 start_codon:yes stop_codon:yes gene_type:complete
MMEKQIPFLAKCYRILLFTCVLAHGTTVLAQVQDGVQVPAVDKTMGEDKAINIERSIKGNSEKVSENDALNVQKIAPLRSSSLPHNLSAWGMFMAADWVVKTVMISLAIASLLTWTVLVSKTIELNALKRLLRHDGTKIMAARTLGDAANVNDILGVGREFIEAAEAELHLSADMASKGGKEGVKERVMSSLSRIEAAWTRRILVGTGLLATIGAVAPFVGLLGTVWGIMNSFIGISKANTTNLAVVAPGIAEALLATALGLVAAIPAVVIYNHFTRQIAGAKALASDSAAAVMRLVSRDLDRAVSLHIVNTTPTETAE